MRQRFYVIVAGLLLVTACQPETDQGTTATGSGGSTTPSASEPATSEPAAAISAAPTTSSPPARTPSATPTVRRVALPNLVGGTVGQARTALSQRGLRWTIRYQATGQFRAGTVISQSGRDGSAVLPGTTIGLVVANAPPPLPPKVAPSKPASDCDPAYPDVCLHDGIGDYDCAGGSGNGPNYVHGPIRVRPPDPFDLDRDGDGIGCQS